MIRILKTGVLTVYLTKTGAASYPNEDRNEDINPIELDPDILLSMSTPNGSLINLGSSSFLG